MNQPLLCTALVLTASLLSSALPVQAEIITEHDRFTGKIKISSKPASPVKDGKVSIALIGFPAPLSLMIVLASHGESWRYLQCTSTVWLVDGERFSLPKVDMVDRKVWRGGRGVAEYLVIHPSLSQLVNLAAGDKIEFKVCNDEYQATRSEIEDLRAFIAQLKANGVPLPPVKRHSGPAGVLTR